MNELNAYLQSLPKNDSKPFEVYIDNHHTALIQFPMEYEMPQISNHILSFEEKSKLTNIFSKLIPNTLSDMNLLPESFPKRDTSKLCYVKELNSKDQTYIHLFKIDVNYLGGCKKEKMIQITNQKQFPSYFTDRIYFYSGIIKVKEIIKKDNEIISFVVKEFIQKNSFPETVDYSEKNKPEIFSEIFDEADTKSLLVPLYEKLEINSKNWKLGKIHQPLSLDHSSLAFKPLQLTISDVFEKFKNFSGILDDLQNNGLEEKLYLEKFHEYLQSHSFVRGLSPAGNIRWKIEFNFSS
jgi:hypothetical protein